MVCLCVDWQLVVICELGIGHWGASALRRFPTLVALKRLPFSQRERLAPAVGCPKGCREMTRSKRTPTGKQATRSVSKSCHAAGFTLRYPLYPYGEASYAQRLRQEKQLASLGIGGSKRAGERGQRSGSKTHLQVSRLIKLMLTPSCILKHICSAPMPNPQFFNNHSLFCGINLVNAGDMYIAALITRD